MEEKENVFKKLCALNVNSHVEKKSDGMGHYLSYLSWPWAIEQVQKNCKSFSYEVVRYENNLPYVYDPNTGYLVTTRVTIDGETKEMWLPVMNSVNKAMKAQPYSYKTKNGEKWVMAATMYDINTAIMRCLVKNLAMFGLGLYIYAGEDIPSNDEIPQAATAPVQQQATRPIPPTEVPQELLKSIEAAKSIKDLTSIWNTNQQYQTNKIFVNTLSEKKKQLK